MMRKRRRLLSFACVATGSLALAGNAFAKPTLTISGSNTVGASAATVVEIKGENTDAAPLRISVYMPQGYAANLGAAAGTQIGTVSATFQALIVSPETVVGVDGTVVVGDRTSEVLRSAAVKCTGTAAHVAVWLLRVVVAGQTLELPVFVDPTTGSEATFSAAKFVLCLANPYEQAQPAGSRAVAGMKIIDAKLTLSAGVFTNPPSAGTYIWRSVTAPWTANSALPNEAGAVEAQSLANIPSALSLKANVRTVRRKKRGRTIVANSVLLSGSLLENLNGIAGAKVTLFANGKTAGSTMTDARGSFARVEALAKKAALKATATVPTRETACVSPLPATFAPAGCAAALIAGYKIGSNTIVATPKKR